ncbi:MAG: hypothetical protein ACFFAE_15240 [Candidatus Hodarchaeota archaeon]
MMMRNFDLSRVDGLIGIYLLGATFSLYIASMVISIVAKSESLSSAVVLLDTAFYLVLVGAISLVVSVVLLVVNSQAAGKTGMIMDPNTRLVVVGLFILTMVSLVLYAVVPTFV